jgi:predicted XRE-type DNA-binding protein
MMRIEEFYRASGMTQAEAATALGLTQPRLNALLKGKIDLFRNPRSPAARRPLVRGPFGL